MWQREDLLDLVLFGMCLPIFSTLFDKHDTAHCIYFTIHVSNHIEVNALPDVWNVFQEKSTSHMRSHIDSVGSVMFVERTSRRQETHKKY